MFWRATLAIAALYYVTVPPAERAVTEAQLRESATALPGQVVTLCQANPAACARLVQQAGGLAAPPPPAAASPVFPAPAFPAPAPVVKQTAPKQLVESAPLPPRRPAARDGQNGA